MRPRTGDFGRAPAAFASSPADVLLDSLARLTGVPRAHLRTQIDQPTLHAAAQALAAPDPPARARLARLIAGPLLLRMPGRLRLAAADVLKRLRSPARRLAHRDPADFLGDRLVAGLLTRAPVTLWGPGKRFCLALTHDVDTRVGYDFLPRLLDELTQRGLRSSFFFLTHGDYRLDPLAVRDVEAAGFEVGLHGRTHDVGIGYRPPAHIRRWLAEACDVLGGVPAGFRAPGLGVSRALLAEVARAGFRYDSSYQTGAAFYHSVGYSFPYQVPGLSLFEVPIWFQDAFLLRDARLGQAAAVAWCAAQIERLRSRSAAVVFVMHPDNMVGRMDFMRRFLDLVAGWQERDALVCPLGEIVQRFAAAWPAGEPQA